MSTPSKGGIDYIFEIAQVIKKQELKDWDERRKKEYWDATAKRCWDSKRDRDLIIMFESQVFKIEVGQSRLFSETLGIQYYAIDRHFGTMRAGAAYILRGRNPELFERSEVM